MGVGLGGHIYHQAKWSGLQNKARGSRWQGEEGAESIEPPAALSPACLQLLEASQIDEAQAK